MFIQEKSKGLRIHFHFEIVRTIFGNVYLFRNIYVQQPLGTNGNDIFCLRWRVECVSSHKCLFWSYFLTWVSEPILYFLTANLCRQSDVYLKKKTITRIVKMKLLMKRNRTGMKIRGVEMSMHCNSYENGHRLKKSFNFF